MWQENLGVQVNGTYLIGEHNINICSLICHGGEFTHLSYSSMKKGVERCTEKIFTHSLNVFRELTSSLTLTTERLVGKA